MTETLQERFIIKVLDYALCVDCTGEVALMLTGGASRKGRGWRTPGEDLFWDEPDYSDVDLARDGLRVLRHAGQVLLAWVFRAKPWRIGFTASTPRKRRVYSWLARRMASKLRGYNLVEWPEGTFNFYRLVNTEGRSTATSAVGILC